MKYCRKSEIVEAEQFWPDKKPWPEGVYRHKNADEYYHDTRVEDEYYYSTRVEAGDYIVTDEESGSQTAIGEREFNQTYEPVEKK